MYSGFKIGGDRFKCIISAFEKCMELYAFNSILKVNQYLAVEEEEDIDGQNTEVKQQAQQQERMDDFPPIQQAHKPNPTQWSRGQNRGWRDKRGYGDYSNKRRRESSSPEEFREQSYQKRQYPGQGYSQKGFFRGQYGPNKYGRKAGGPKKY